MGYFSRFKRFLIKNSCLQDSKVLKNEIKDYDDGPVEQTTKSEHELVRSLLEEYESQKRRSKTRKISKVARTV